MLLFIHSTIKQDSPALGSIPLGMVVCYVPFKNETDRPYSFALQTPDRTFYLSSETEAEMKRWVDAIKQAIHDIFVNVSIPSPSLLLRLWFFFFFCISLMIVLASKSKSPQCSCVRRAI
jgi:hypothetical protein